MNRDKLKLVAGILLGSVALHVLMVACSPDSSGEPSAHAQAAAQICEQWQVQGFLPSSYKFQLVNGVDVDGSPDQYSFPVVDSFDLPEGWEPFASESLLVTMARRCIKYRE